MLPPDTPAAAMDNTFYTDFDTAQFEGLVGDGDREGTRGQRTPFEQDRDRIIHSFAFRRLQAKTQVFLSGEYDFYRTRLTHSIEVAQIGRAICAHLRRSDDHFRDDFCVDEHLVEAACLAHDIGHPPFGHSGERKLNSLMAMSGGFEGNAQTLRILTDTLYGSGGHRQGMKPTRALMDAVLKYKTLHHLHPSSIANIPSPPKNHFLYDDQESSLSFVFDGTAFPDALTPGDVLDEFKSIECQIMDWSDDTAFSINDTMDGIRAGFITIDRIARWCDEYADQRDDEDTLSPTDEVFLDELVEAVKTGNAERFLSKRIGLFVTGCRVVERDVFMSDRTNRYRYSLEIEPEVKRQRHLLKSIATDLMFRNPRVLQLEMKGGWMLERLFETLSQHYAVLGPKTSPLLPMDVHSSLMSKAGGTKRIRLLCDYVAGMTDGYATRTYKRLFDPDFGSFVDLV